MSELYHHFNDLYPSILKKVLIALVCISATIPSVFAAPPTNLHYRTKTSGDWSAASTWENSTNLTNWSPATSAPDDNDLTITIMLSHTVAITSNTNLDQLTIQGTLVFLDGKMSILNGAVGAVDDIIISATGRLNVLKTGNGNINANLQISAGAGINVKRGGIITVGDGSTTAFGVGYELLATNVNSNWESGSVYVHNNNNVLDLDGTSVLFPKSAISGSRPTFRINKISAANNFLCGSTFGTLEANTILNIAGGTVTNIRDGLTGVGVINIFTANTSSFSISGPGAIIAGSLTLTIDKNINLTNGLTIPAGANIKVTDISKQNIVLAPNQTFFVDGGTPSAIFDIGSSCTFNGSNSTTTVDIAGTFKTGNVNGLKGSGASILSPNLILRSNSTIDYNGTNQVVSTLPVYYNLTISNAGTKTNTTITMNDMGTLEIINNATLLSSGNISSPTNTANLAMDNSARYILTNGSTQPEIAGTYNLLGNSVIEFNGNVSQTIRTSGTNKIYNNIEVTGNNVGNSSGNILLKSNGTFKVMGTGSFTINNNSIQVAPASTNVSVSVLPGGIFRVGDPAGFNGTTSTAIDASITNISLDPNSTVNYTRAGDQNITNANNLIYGNLTLSNSGIKTAPTDTLSLRGNFTNALTGTNTFAHRSGTVSFVGNTTQNYYAGATGTIFHNLENRNAASVIINAKATIENELKLSLPAARMTLNEDVTLRSTLNNTAAVAEITAGIDPFTYGSGKGFVIERYLPGFKAWRLLSVPVQNSTAQFIFDAWQEGGANIAGTGVQISSPLYTVGGTNGFDYFTPLSAFKVWDPVLNNYVSITNTKTTNIGNKEGYYIFVRSDRAAVQALSIVTPTTLKAKGRINVLAQTFPTVPFMRFASIGNPYPSRVAFGSIAKTNIADGFTVWNPSLPGISNVGGFETYSKKTNGNYETTTGASRSFIESGEAFFIQNNIATNGTVSIAENAKRAGSAVVSRNGAANASLRLLLNTRNAAGADYIATAALINFEESYSNGLDNDDFRKFQNSTENITVVNGSFLLEVERRKMATEADTIFLSTTRMQSKPYTLQLMTSDIVAPGLEAFLIDRFTNSRTAFSLDGSTDYPFLVTGNAASAAANRFHIIFKQSILLPVNFVSIDAKRNADKTVTVSWKVESETFIKNYVIEHGTDDINFQSIGTVLALRNSGANTYEFTHATASSKVNFYRIRSINLAATSRISATAKVNALSNGSMVQIIPNPVKNGVINVQSNLAEGKYTVRIIDAKGAIIFSGSIMQSSGITNNTFRVGNVATGIYQLLIVDAENKTISTKLFIE